MFSLNPRLAVLAVFCCISAQWLLPSLSAQAAVISRNSRSMSPFRLAANDASSHSQHVFPWSSSKNGFYKVRSTNPIQQFADAMFSRIKHGRHRRSHKTIVIPAGHGKDYIISHQRRSADGTPQWITGHGNSTNSTMSTQSNGGGNQGAIQIQSQSTDPSQADTFLGWLFHLLNDDVLNASESNKTNFQMINAVDPSTQRQSTASGETTPVYVQSNDRCATFKSNPAAPEPMRLKPCGNSSALTANSTSQIFMFNHTSNELRPSWNPEPNGAHGDANTNSPSGTSAASGSPASSTSLSSREDVNTQTVKLTWVPADRLAAADVSEASSDTQNRDSTSSAMTTTMTQTVTVFQPGSASSTSTSTSGGSSSTGLSVEVVGGSPSSSASQYYSSSMSMMDVPNTSTASSATPSQSIDAAAIASSIAASASASMSSASASSPSTMATAADVSATTASSTASSDASSNTFVAAVVERAAWVRQKGGRR